MSSRSTLPSVILALLAGGPMHPYRIQHVLRQRLKDEVSNMARRAGVYQAIRRLEREGLVRSHSVGRDDKYPERTNYELTDSGRASVTGWLRNGLATPKRDYPEFPAVLSFLEQLTPAEAQAALEERLAALDAEEGRMAARFEEWLAIPLPRLFLVEKEYSMALARAERGLGGGVGLRPGHRRARLDPRVDPGDPCPPGGPRPRAMKRRRRRRVLDESNLHMMFRDPVDSYFHSIMINHGFFHLSSK